MVQGAATWRNLLDLRGVEPSDNPETVPFMIHNPIKHLNYAKKEILMYRYYDVPTSLIAEKELA